MMEGLNLKVIIYDCDGVLIDSRAANQAFYNHILARFGLPPLTPEQWAEVAPLTAPEALNLLFAGTPHLDAAQEYQRQVDNTPFLPLIRVEPNLVAALSRLKARHRTAIATNRGKSLGPVLKHCGLAEWFDFLVSSLEVKNPKPHPECLERVLSHFGVSPQEACYIGDSEVDQKTAARAGVIFGAYRNPSLQADFHLADHLELWHLLR